MKDILFKSSSLRRARATATVRLSDMAAMQAVIDRKVPKGDVFEFSRAAGLLAIKRTPEAIPDCHPLPMESASITFTTEGLDIIILVDAATIYKTGVEVEAMHGAAVTALTIYDMLKPLDKKIEITAIRLQEKSGGKTDRLKNLPPALRCAVIVCSDRVSRGEAEDKSGKAIVSFLNDFGYSDVPLTIVEDSVVAIQSAVKSYQVTGKDLILLTGGTGLSSRDVTPEAVTPLIDRMVPGIMETARRYGQDRMPFAMLSRGVAGFFKDTLVITLPGSLAGVNETLDALFPAVLHVFAVRKGDPH